VSTPIVLPTDLQILGTLTANLLNVPLGSITDTQVIASANIAATKLQKQFQENYSNTDSATSAASEQRVLHTVKGSTGTVNEFAAGAVVVLVAPATCTIDLLKNGSSILTAAVALAAGDTPRVVKFGTFSSTSVVAGDVLEVKVTATAGGGTLPKGVFVRLTVTENAP
jgi:hypothetical protein